MGDQGSPKPLILCGSLQIFYIFIFHALLTFSHPFTHDHQGRESTLPNIVLRTSCQPDVMPTRYQTLCLGASRLSIENLWSVCKQQLRAMNIRSTNVRTGPCFIVEMQKPFPRGAIRQAYRCLAAIFHGKISLLLHLLILTVQKLV